MRHAGTQGSLTPDSKFTDLADAWLDDLRLDVDRAESTKETYERQLRSSVLPFFADFAVREITVGRIERYLKQQRLRSFSMAKHSKTTLSMVLAFGVRQGLLERNPVKETSQLKKPKRVPKALTPEELAAIRTAAREFGTDPHWLGPRPDGQVRDLIEVTRRQVGCRDPRVSDARVAVPGDLRVIPVLVSALMWLLLHACSSCVGDVASAVSPMRR